MIRVPGFEPETTRLPAWAGLIAGFVYMTFGAAEGNLEFSIFGCGLALLSCWCGYQATEK